ncbi:MAG: hypothetical protein EB059_08410 [Alphaproteobacteria bacterium]|nr:hypothetical protein [Alphaproteobacteria bacterium]
MTIDPNLPSKLSITSSGPRPVRTPGATRATFAFLFSLLALIASGYVLFTNLDEHQDKIISPLVTAKASSPDLESRIKAQETALTVMNDAFKKQIDGLQEKLNTLPEPKTKVIDTSASTLALQGKFAEWEKQNAELQQRLRSELQEKSKNIAALALLEHITRKAHLGLSFQNDVKSLENAIPLSEHSAHAYTILRGFDIGQRQRALPPALLKKNNFQKTFLHGRQSCVTAH